MSESFMEKARAIGAGRKFEPDKYDDAHLGQLAEISIAYARREISGRQFSGALGIKESALQARVLAGLYHAIRTGILIEATKEAAK